MKIEMPVRSRIRPAGVLSAWACLAGMSVLAATAQPAVEDWVVERREQTWEVEHTATIRLDNPWGDVAVRAHKRAEIYLLVNWQHHREDPRVLEVVAEHEPGAVKLRTRFNDQEADTAPTDWTLRRADVTLFVPERATTHFATTNGKLEVRGTRGPTTVETGGGDIRLRISGSATARTEHGSVLAQFRGTDWTQPVEIVTATGPIRVELPSGAAPGATLETRGEITSDYSMDVGRVEGSLLKRARLRPPGAGSSRGTLKLRSHSGPIAVVETLVPAEKGGERK